MIIPDKNLFVVTSALNTGIGIIDPDTRFKQTVECLQNLREKCPDDIILFADGSPYPVKEEYKRVIDTMVNVSGYFGAEGPVHDLASSGRKSEAENVLMLKCMMLIKREPGLMRLMQSVSRIYKLSARTIINLLILVVVIYRTVIA